VSVFAPPPTEPPLATSSPATVAVSAVAPPPTVSAFAPPPTVSAFAPPPTVSAVAPRAVAAPPAAPVVSGDSFALDPGVVREIGQRKTLFRMCYESAKRRGVQATRADVSWILGADGAVRDVEVVVADDATLARCIRAVASRSFPAGAGQDMPVVVPLLFVGAR
jgi:hypothetical protein